MIIWHISDTHNHHDELFIPDNVDMVIHSGDAANDKNPDINYNQWLDFIKWYTKLNIKYKIYVPGNHDAALYYKYFIHKDFEKRGIILLEDEEIIINNIKIYGSPWTPTFGTWYFTKEDLKLKPIWEQIPDDVNILITHGPANGINDISPENTRKGSETLSVRIKELKDLKFHLYGHFHDTEDGSIINFGVSKVDNYISSNASIVTLKHDFKNKGNLLIYE